MTFLITTNVYAQNFHMWVEGPPLFTIAKTESVNVYVKNDLYDGYDNYTVTYSKSPPEASHLIDVNMPTNRINRIKRGDVGGVLARVTLLGPISPTTLGAITFDVASDSPGSSSEQIQIISAPPINLPEFGFIGLIQLLILASLILVVSYSSHFR